MRHWKEKQKYMIGSQIEIKSKSKLKLQNSELISKPQIHNHSRVSLTNVCATLVNFVRQEQQNFQFSPSMLLPCLRKNLWQDGSDGGSANGELANLRVGLFF
jgi:DNA-directed RNA polymerase